MFKEKLTEIIRKQVKKNSRDSHQFRARVNKHMTKTVSYKLRNPQNELRWKESFSSPTGSYTITELIKVSSFMLLDSVFLFCVYCGNTDGLNLITYTLLWLASFTMYNLFMADPCCSMYEYFAFHFMDK